MISGRTDKSGLRGRGVVQGAQAREKSGLFDRLSPAGLRPLTGGFNNTVYAWERPGHDTEVIKLYKTDGYGPGQREWIALTQLHGIHPATRPHLAGKILANPRPRSA
ncbi:hypothetical protein ACFV0L_28530 [Streptosporangium canum]|uniref:hypothetical protein n=1 Tax=Streptosporangium canum TaxID=324952 RepID=UPI00368F086B